MSITTAIPHPERTQPAKKDEAKSTLLDRLSHLGRAFWEYTEEAGEASTKSYEGWL